MIPKNLLGLALKAIGSTTISYMRYVSKVTGRGGIDVPTFADAIPLKGSFQPLPKELYAQNGLDFNKHYFTFYCSAELIEIDRDVSSDRITYASETYQVLTKNDWFAYNGWEGVLCVRL